MSFTEKIIYENEPFSSDPRHCLAEVMALMMIGLLDGLSQDSNPLKIVKTLPEAAWLDLADHAINAFKSAHIKLVQVN